MHWPTQCPGQCNGSILGKAPNFRFAPQLISVVWPCPLGMPIVTSPGTRPAGPGMLPRRPMGALTRTSAAQSARNLWVLTGASEVRQKCQEFAPGCEVGRTNTWGTRARRRHCTELREAARVKAPEGNNLVTLVPALRA